MIKQTAYEMYFQHHLEEIPIAQALDEGFDVNYAKVYNSNNIELSYYFISGNAQFRERFGLDQEILAIYNWHDKPDARIFSAVSDLLNKYKKTRLDSAVVLLILEGEHKDKIQPMLDKNKEIAFIVVDKKELIASSRSPYFLRRSFTNVLGSIDLYSLSSPLETDTYLFGREDVINETMNKITLQKENAGIFGLRKTGKTSVLFALQRRFDNQDILSVYIDCQLTIYKFRWWRLLEYIAHRISQRANEVLGLDEEENLFTGYTEDNCQIKFERILHKVLGHVKQVVLLIDEIEYITPTLSMVGATHWDEDFIPFWQTIRGIRQQTHGKLAFTLAGVNPYITENAYIDEKQNPIFQLVQPTYLKPLDRTVVRNMVRRIGKYLGMKYDEQVYEFLRSEFGGHAFLIRLACSELFRNSKHLINDHEYTFGVSSFEKIMDKIMLRLKSPSMDIILSLIWWYPEEYEIIKVVCDGDLVFVRDYMNGHVSNTTHIISYGLLDEMTYDFQIKILKKYLIDYANEWEKKISPFKRSGFTENQLPLEADISLLSKIYEDRAQLEQKLRKIIYLQLGFSVGFDQVKLAKKLLEGIKHRHKNPEDLFFGREPKQVMNELYFRDLQAIISKHWTVFAGLFNNQKQRFDMNMETIADVRNEEAHIKPLTDEEVLNFKNSFSWIKLYVEKVEF